MLVCAAPVIFAPKGPFNAAESTTGVVTTAATGAGVFLIPAFFAESAAILSLSFFISVSFGPKK
ncbi:hypothetical protein D3C86_2061290 [compost metagenome]